MILKTGSTRQAGARGVIQGFGKNYKVILLFSFTLDIAHSKVRFTFLIIQHYMYISFLPNTLLCPFEPVYNLYSELFFK